MSIDGEPQPTRLIEYRCGIRDGAASILHKWAFGEIDLQEVDSFDEAAPILAELIQKTGHATGPVLFAGERLVQGYEAIYRFFDAHTKFDW